MTCSWGEVEVRCEVVDVDVLRWRGHRHPRRQVGRQRWGWCLSNTCQFFAETVVHCYLIITVSGGSKAGPPTPCWSESKTAVADPKAKSMLGAGSCLQENCLLACFQPGVPEVQHDFAT